MLWLKGMNNEEEKNINDYVSLYFFILEKKK